ncbi:HAMP domain-containing protein [Candidatus Bipolaricaulota bacterium]|nr:HAMP domain-containing protein [Candidatus Bipolaricaulota bacterium]
MTRRIPLAVKLGVSFVVVILLAVALIYGLIMWAIPQQFDEYRRMSQEAFGNQLAAQLVVYREQERSWVGVAERVLYRTIVIDLGEESIVGNQSIFDVPLTLIDVNGRVIASTDNEWRNQQKVDENGSIWLTEEEAKDGILLILNGEWVGTLRVSDVGSLGAAASSFLSTVAESTLIGGGIAIGLALLLSTMLIIQILRPLRALSRATERVAEGDMPERVNLKTHDELGRLGDSFNHMLESLRLSETVRHTMTADIAHELRTPVTIIQGTLEAILDGIYDASEEFLAPIYEETLHLGRLIDDLRDLALAEAGELRLEKDSVDIIELIKQVSETAFLSREDAPTLHLDMPNVLPKVQLDRKRFRQVIANLLSNAIRHTPKDGDVYIRARRVNGDIEMSVADTGPGIKPEDLQHLFERFYRGDPARGRSAGSGLGLAIVKQWVEAHGGTIEVENRQSGGARFVVHIPVR